MSIKAYPEYADLVDTGCSSVGQIPRDWRIARIRHAAHISPSRRLDGNTGRNDPVVFLPMEAVGNNGQIEQSDIRYAKEVSEGFTYFQKGDVIMAKITPCFENGKAAYLDGLATAYGFGTTELHVLRPKHGVGKFLYYFLHRQSFRSYSAVFMVGSAGQKRVSTDFLKDQVIPLPPVTQQRAIAAFLDEKCAQIDEAVRIKEEQIKLLRERRQILIQQAVTRGLNPSAPMKDSGIDWIGQIPAHWEVRRGKHLFREVNERSEEGKEELLSVSHTTGVTARSEKNVNMFMAEDYTGSKLCQPGDVVINTMWAWMGALGVSGMSGIVSPSYGVYQPLCEDTFNPYFLEWLLRTTPFIEQYNKISTGLHSSRLRLYPHMFLGLPMAFPNRDEQDVIVKSVNKEAGKVDKAISIKRDQITALKEYKTTLINAAVTGKIKITEDML